MASGFRNWNRIVVDTAAEPGKSNPESAPATVTVTERLTLPPAPLQPSVKVLVTVSGLDVSLPEVALVPDQAPEALHEVTLVEDHVSVEVPPLATDVGVAARDSVGAGGVTVTVDDALAVPPDPEHARANVLVLVNAGVDWLPAVGFAPDQAPEAEQEVAFVEDQVRTEDPPLTTDVGVAVSDTLGTAAGGGAPDTVTVVDAFALPPEPVQVRR
jgi:hypothetical protein